VVADEDQDDQADYYGVKSAASKHPSTAVASGARKYKAYHTETHSLEPVVNNDGGARQTNDANSAFSFYDHSSMNAALKKQ